MISSEAAPPPPTSPAPPQFNPTVAEVDGWAERFREGCKEGLRAVSRDVEARHEAERKDLLAKVGELTLQADALKKTTRSASTMLEATRPASGVQM